MQRAPAASFAAVMGIWSMLAYAHVAAVNRLAPEPYMDEPFHVRQTRQYCEGNWDDWDPKITTFPGLYLAGVGYARLLQLVSALWRASAVDTCSTAALRTLNAVLNVACLGCFVVTYAQLHPRLGLARFTAAGVMMSLFPLHFFFMALYYTDTGSTLLVIGAHLLALRGWYLPAGLAAAAATGFRQTNAVWAAFTLAVAVMHECRDSSRPQPSDLSLTAEFRRTFAAAWHRKARLAGRLWPLAAVPAAFAAFVVRNGGVVVGDRSAHAPVKHLMQPLYFVGFAALALAPVLLRPARLYDTARATVSWFRKTPLIASVSLAVSLAATLYLISNFSLVHPYLIADNRHYTFYLWKNWFAKGAVNRLILTPLYILSAHAVLTALRRRQSALWVVAWLTAVCMTLVPAWLIEFRYFTVPFLMLVLHMEPPSGAELAVTAAAWGAVDAGAAYMFLWRPFIWPDGTVARFMW